MRPPAIVPALLLLASPPSAGAQPIAPHPDKLRFASFRYAPPDAKDHRVVLPKSQVPAYLAVDRELPLITITVLVRGGDYLDPPGKEGLADLAGYLLTRGGVDGRRPLDAQALDERAAYLAAQLQSAVDETSGVVSMNLLAKDLDEGLTMLRDVLTAPRFEERRLALRKEQLLSEMKQRNDDSGAIEARERNRLAYGAGHFSNRLSTKASIERLTREDLRAFHQRVFHPRNFIVAAAGDFDRAAMVQKLDALVSAWPFAGEVLSLDIPKPTEKLQPGVYLVDKGDVTQGRVSILGPGLLREDPDYIPVLVMNQVLGGGGFISRITNRVRSDEGLAYSAGSRFYGGVHYAGVFWAGFQSKLRSCSYASALVLEEIGKLREGGVTAEELAAGKQQLIESLPQRFRTKAAVVSALADEELTGRYPRVPDYFARFPERVSQVSAADVLRVAKRWLDPKGVAILLVGKKGDLLNPDPKHPVTFQELASRLGPLVDVPLRDPLTLLPLAKAP